MPAKIIQMNQGKATEKVQLELGREPEKGHFVAYWPAFPIFSASGASPEDAFRAFEESFPCLNISRPSPI